MEPDEAALCLGSFLEIGRRRVGTCDILLDPSELLFIY